MKNLSFLIVTVISTVGLMGCSGSVKSGTSATDTDSEPTVTEQTEIDKALNSDGKFIFAVINSKKVQLDGIIGHLSPDRRNVQLHFYSKSEEGDRGCFPGAGNVNALTVYTPVAVGQYIRSPKDRSNVTVGYLSKATREIVSADDVEIVISVSNDVEIAGEIRVKRMVKTLGRKIYLADGQFRATLCQ